MLRTSGPYDNRNLLRRWKYICRPSLTNFSPIGCIGSSSGSRQMWWWRNDLLIITSKVGYTRIPRIKTECFWCYIWSRLPSLSVYGNCRIAEKQNRGYSGLVIRLTVSVFISHFNAIGQRTAYFCKSLSASPLSFFIWRYESISVHHIGPLLAIARLLLYDSS